ncbi:hypothetical protein KUCAC02_030381, partial [Chaenocephalus aceratus]
NFRGSEATARDSLGQRESDRKKKETTTTTELSKGWDSCPTFNHQSSAWRLNGVTVERKLG